METKPRSDARGMALVLVLVVTLYGLVFGTNWGWTGAIVGAIVGLGLGRTLVRWRLRVVPAARWTVGHTWMSAAILATSVGAVMFAFWGEGWDLVVCALGFALSWGVWRVTRRPWRALLLRIAPVCIARRAWPRAIGVMGLTFLMILMVFWFVEEQVSPRRQWEEIKVDPFRFTRFDGSRERPVLALSGGGYRAALMHAGVLHELDAMNTPPRALSCVSGGAIIGAYYALGGEPEQFLRIVQSGKLRLSRRAILPGNLLGLLGAIRVPKTEYRLFGWFCRDFGFRQLQADALDDLLFRGAMLTDLSVCESESGRPALMICMTDLITGDAVGVSPEGMCRVPAATNSAGSSVNGAPAYRGHYQSHAHYRWRGDGRLATWVSASGAFPGAFNALVTSYEQHQIAGDNFEMPFVGADGGVRDNLGVTLALEMSRIADWKNAKKPEYTKSTDGAPNTENKLPPLYGEPASAWLCDRMSVSDGGAVFFSDSAGVKASSIGHLFRAIDVLYEDAKGSETAWKASALQYSPESLLRGTPWVEGGTARVDAAIVDFPLWSRKTGARSLFWFLEQEDWGGIERIIDALPGPEREAGRWELEQCGALRSALSRLDPLVLHEQHPVKRLHKRIERDIARCLQAFYETSTLDDTIDPSDSEDLFRLGRYLVWLADGLPAHLDEK